MEGPSGLTVTSACGFGAVEGGVGLAGPAVRVEALRLGVLLDLHQRPGSRSAS
ncbi:hypothetical protein OG453_03440 [Streptomyces sp. NBC_01381]|uniref:hypothetical protein n=1 Tax=Streptomyces sp. NBC_01381 TaxID=2903845 RepID=UPI00224D1A0B|nr:hypothetical protein [Streptomyces sp. NBC_01381]MCX4665737.1 hypothetical protein [Streptomyces sp. NBC_01381]